MLEMLKLSALLVQLENIAVLIYRPLIAFSILIRLAIQEHVIPVSEMDRSVAPLNNSTVLSTSTMQMHKD